MTWAQRRARSRVPNKLETVMAASEADGRPWHIVAITGGRDCQATADLRGQGRTGPRRHAARRFADDAANPGPKFFNQFNQGDICRRPIYLRTKSAGVLFR